MVHRLDRLPGDVARDTDHMQTVARVTTAWHEALDQSPTGRVDPALAEVRWLIEELRVSLFAQALGTPSPVSEKRLLRAIERAGTS
jgi:ATP-dependent helicase HrpA